MLKMFIKFMFGLCVLVYTMAFAIIMFFIQQIAQIIKAVVYKITQKIEEKRGDN